MEKCKDLITPVRCESKGMGGWLVQELLQPMNYSETSLPESVLGYLKLQEKVIVHFFL